MPINQQPDLPDPAVTKGVSYGTANRNHIRAKRLIQVCIGGVESCSECLRTLLDMSIR
jgi:hypothetical protein